MKHHSSVVPVRKSTFRWVGLAVVVFLFCSVLPAKVKVFQKDKKALARCKTYQWEPVRLVTKKGIVDDDPEFTPVLKQAINRQMAAKGYTEVAKDGEMRLLAAGLRVTSSQLEGFLVSWGFDFYWGYYGVNTVSPVSRINHEGTLVVGLLDAETKQILWNGYATEALGGPGSVKETIEKIVSRLFKKLPKRKN